MKTFLAFLLLSTVLMTNVSFCQVSNLEHKQGEQIECLYKTTSDLIDCQIQIQTFMEHDIQLIEMLSTKVVAQESIINDLQNNIKYYVLGIVIILVLLVLLYLISYINIDKLNDVIKNKNETAIFNPLEEQAILRLMNYSFNEIDWEYTGLTPNERNCISRETFNSIRDKYRKNKS